MKTDLIQKPRIIIRIGQRSLAFALPKQDGTLTYEPYTVKSGMSMAANLREAFKESDVLRTEIHRVLVLVESPVLLVPLEEYDEEQEQEMYKHSFPDSQHSAVMHYIMNDLNCVAVFSINKDVRMVITDHYEDARIMPAMTPVWAHLHQRSYSGHAKKLFTYYHDDGLDVFAFSKNRFKFQNRFTAKTAADCLYFTLYVWKQLVMDQKKDELFFVGDFAEKEQFKDELKQYVQNTFVINPSGEFNRAQVTQIPQITYDIICLCES